MLEIKWPEYSIWYKDDEHTVCEEGDDEGDFIDLIWIGHVYRLIYKSTFLIYI